MSTKREQKRARQARRTNQRAAQRANRPLTREEIALRVVRDNLVPLASRDPLDAELVASWAMASGWEQVLELGAGDEHVDQPHPALAVVSLLRTLRVEPGELADAALALAHALAAADPEDPQLVAASGVLVEQLRESGAQDPHWVGRTGRYTLAWAHDIRDVWMDQHQLLLCFCNEDAVEGEERREHGLMALVDRTEGMQLVELQVIDGAAKMLDDVRASIEQSDQRELMRIDELSPARAGALLQAAIEGTFDEYGDALRENGSLDLLHVAIERAALLEDAVEADADDAHRTPFDTELDDVSRDELAERFAASDELAAEPGATAEAVDRLVDWVHLLAYPRALFGPDQAGELLVEYLPQVVEGDARTDQVDANLAAARAWARHCAALLQLDKRAVDDVLGAIEHYADQHATAMADPAPTHRPVSA